MSLERIAQYADLGITDYAKTYDLQKHLAEKRAKDEIPDTILIAEHLPIINFGMRDVHNTFSNKLYKELKEKKIESTHDNIIKYLKTLNIDFSRSSRGGGATYIGPGQLNIYPIVKYEEIVKQSFNIDAYKNLVDELMNEVLQSFNVNTKIARDIRCDDEAAREKNRKDVWLEINNKHYKLGGKGIHISKDVAYHGFNFYVKKGSTEGFRYVDACGYQIDEVGVINVEEALKKDVDMQLFKEKVLSEIKTKFNYDSINKIELTRI
jgi:lipoyl(octanoyl) transferase